MPTGGLAMSALSGIHHVSINVTDVEAARQFYVDALGLELLPRPELGVPGLWMRAGAQEVHLLGMTSGAPLPEQHFAFAVADLDALRERLGTLDIRVSVPMEIPGICRQAFTRDPSGNLVEFNQRL
ncbi:MAG TPA: lactoylglutathione lyase [Gammaproteobacteria bacterium]|nr:lactoylglutathione lyase [Gammaproteobacteria bacterium]